MSKKSGLFVRKGTPPTPLAPYPSDQEVRECSDGTTEIYTPIATPKIYEEYERAIEQYPQDVELRVQYAFQLHYNDLSKAVEQLQVAITLEPDLAYAHSLLASLLRQSGATKTAIEEYHQAIMLSVKENTESPQAEVIIRAGLAETLRQDGDIEGARIQLQTAITRQQEYVNKEKGSQQLLNRLETNLRELDDTTN